MGTKLIPSIGKDFSFIFLAPLPTSTSLFSTSGIDMPLCLRDVLSGYGPHIGITLVGHEGDMRVKPKMAP